MSPSAQKICTHQRGPGTTVCLRCRYEERERARTNFVRVLLRGSAVVLVGGVVVVAVAGGAISLRRQQRAAPVKSAAVSDSGAPGQRLTNAASTSSGSVADSASGTTPPVAAPVAPVSPVSAPVQPKAFEPTLAMGRTELSDSVYAMRADSAVRVVFDTQMGRTRRRDKFEQIVRATLPKVYGPKAESALALVPEGAFAVDGNLMAELPARGIRLAVPTGGVIVIWPETREGRDGLLIVSYRTTVER